MNLVINNYCLIYLFCNIVNLKQLKYFTNKCKILFYQNHGITQKGQIGVKNFV